MSILNSLGNVFNAGSMGSVWKPKSSRIRVGRDVAALTATGFSGGTSRNTVLGHGDDVTLKSTGLFEYARRQAQNGSSVQSFRGLSAMMEEAFKNGDIESDIPVDLKGSTIYQKGDYSVSYNSLVGSLDIYKKDAVTGEYVVFESVSADTDIRITWNESGEPQILTGNAALTNGKLAAKGDNEILIRNSNADVVAGNNTVVFNASASAGTFSGGNNVTYLGSYQGGTFTDTEGDVTFAGYFSGSTFSDLVGKSMFSGVFEASSIELEEGEGTFSGYFSGSDVNAGKNGSTVSGLFINASTVRGGDGDDTFSGRFIDSKVDGGGGDDSFGNASSMAQPETLVYQQGSKAYSYSGLAADFINSTVNMGEGNDRFKGVMWGGSLNLEDGENTVEGMFGEATVNGGDGDDKLSATYSHASTFNTGLGDDSVLLTTAIQSTVNTDEGKNTVSLGKNDTKPTDKTWQTRDAYFSKDRPAESGELQHNTVNTEKGDNTLAIHNGESTVAVLDANKYEEETEEGTVKEKPLQENAPSGNASASAQADPAASLELSLSRELTKVAAEDSQETENEEGTAGPANNRTMRHAIGRYQQVYGFDPLETGEARAVTVNTSSGDSLTFHGIKRNNAFEEIPDKPGMIRTVRRSGGDGTYTWQRWTQLQA